MRLIFERFQGGVDTLSFLRMKGSGRGACCGGTKTSPDMDQRLKAGPIGRYSDQGYAIRLPTANRQKRLRSDLFTGSHRSTQGKEAEQNSIQRAHTGACEDPNDKRNEDDMREGRKGIGMQAC